MNSQSDFVHLQVHTYYSLLKSSCTVSALIDKCAQVKQKAMAITDYGNMFGVLDFYFSAKAKNIKPILGLQVYTSPGRYSEKRNWFNSASSSSAILAMHSPYLVLLAQNKQGYQNLCHINTVAYQEGFYYIPRVDYEVLNKHCSSVIALTGGYNGETAQLFFKQGADSALRQIQKLKKIYADRLYLQLNRNGVAEEESFNTFLQSVGREYGIPVVASGNVHFINREDFIAQDVLFCIGANRTLKDSERFKLPSDQFYLKSSQEMRDLFKDIPSACDNTLEICSRCDVEFLLQKDGRPIYHLPNLKLGGSKVKENSTHKLRELTFEGFDKRWAENQNKSLSFSSKMESSSVSLEVKADEQEHLKNKYMRRLEEELQIIRDMGFAGYFLIVYDFVHWAKKEGIPVGPGRGSGASSLVAFCLEITDLDPMPYNLLFERFLNPERISLPDFDIDFCQEHRNRVIEYVIKRYGKDYVAQVMTYGRLQAKAAVRDVGRVLGMSYSEVDQIAKMIPNKIGITLDEALKGNTQLIEWMETRPQVENLIRLARQIEGLIRHVSIHAAGVIIADNPIISFAPLYRGSEGENIIQCDLNISKKMGLVKFDFLGLKTLTQIDYAFQMIEENQGKSLSVKNIALEDKGIYELMSSGNTKGVFQFEGEGITELIIKAQPSCFEDIVAINALFRPGPMEMIPSYLKRKKGNIKKTDYIFSDLEPVLKETYGIIVYQEQVLLIAAKIAGYSYGEADVLRRAMGEKKPAVMKKQKTRFLDGARKNGYALHKSEKLFELVAEFAKYGFNKSHAAAYCVLATQTAWLKKYYPVEFFASLLSIEINNIDKVILYVRDAESQGVVVKPPHISYSGYLFTPVKKHIYFSLGAIKGVGKSAVEHIIQVRQSLKNKQFESVSQFFKKIDIKKLNKTCIESLVKAGALDGMEFNRREIIENYDCFVDQIGTWKKESESGQINFFSQEKDGEAFSYLQKQEYPFSKKLEYEKSVLGFYFTGHPMDSFKDLRQIGDLKSIMSLKEFAGGSVVSIGGVLASTREVTTKKGAKMAFGLLEDETGRIELVLFSDVYQKLISYPSLAEEPFFIKGTLEIRNNSVKKIIVQEVDLLWNYIRSRAKGVSLFLSEKQSEIENSLKDFLLEHKGATALYFIVSLNNPSKKVYLKSADFSGVHLSKAFLEKAEKLLGQQVQIF